MLLSHSTSTSYAICNKVLELKKIATLIHMQDVGKKFTSRFGDSSLMEGFQIVNGTVQFEKSADRSLPISKQSIFVVYESSQCFSFIYVCQKVLGL